MVADHWPPGSGADTPAVAAEEMDALRVNMDPDFLPHGPFLGGIEPKQEMRAAVLAASARL
jgi:hypothetical protein